MKSLTGLCIACMWTTISLAQVDTAEKKMAPPDSKMDAPVNNYDNSMEKNQVAPKDKTSVQPQDSRNQHASTSNPDMNDGLMMKNGTVVMTREGIGTVVREMVMLDNGAQLKPDGTIVQTDGSAFQLKEGVRYDLSGNIKPEQIVPAEKKSQTTPEPAKTPMDKNMKSEQPEKSSKTEHQKPADNRNMYLVPDSSVKDYKKDSSPK